MRYFAILALATILLLAACTPTVQEDTTPTTITCPDGTEIPADAECPQPEEELEEVEEQEEESVDLRQAAFDRNVFQEIFGSDQQPTPPVGGSLEDIQARALQQTLNGYTYTYEVRSTQSGFEEPLYQGARISVREGEQAIVLASTTTRRELDTYINGVGYCARCSPSPEPREVEMPQPPSPLDIVLSLEDASEARSAQSIGGRQTLRLTATLNGEEAEIFIDTFSGLPVEVRQGVLTHRFEQLVMNARDDRFAAPY